MEIKDYRFETVPGPFSSESPEKTPGSVIAIFKGKNLLYFTASLVFLLFIGQKSIIAQSTSSDLGFRNLETPASTGLILFDAATATIEKPTTPQGLSLSLSGFGKNAAALDFAPFWLCAHPKLTAKDLYTNKVPIISHLTVSFASFIELSNYYSAGIRTRIFQTYGKNAGKLEGLEKNMVDALSNREWEKADSLRKKYFDLSEKPVFNFDVAAAFGGLTEMGNKFENIEFSRWAAWLSLSWRPKGDDFYLTVLSRYIKNEFFGNILPTSDLVDLGARFNYDLSKFTFSLEFVNRMNFNPEASFYNYRLALLGTYKLNENIFVTSTFGRDFNERENIIALAGFSFGFSRNKVKAF